jgi:hypothetical protein
MHHRWSEFVLELRHFVDELVETFLEVRLGFISIKINYN